MKKNLVKRAGATIIMVLSLSGCGASQNNVSLLSRPVLDYNKETIQKVVEELLPSDAQYVTAKKSEPKQSIFIDDMNNDGIKEAIILYQGSKDNQQIHIMVLTNTNEKWSKRTDLATDYSYLDNFYITDLDGDGNKELVAGLGYSNEDSNKQLFIYKLNEKSLVKNVDATYEWLDIADYDGDKQSDILLLSGGEDQSHKAELFSYKENQLHSKASLELMQYTYQENVVSGKLADGEQALYIDSGVGAHSMVTEIVTFHDGKLVKVGDESDETLFKAYPLYSKDINEDGIIEVGGMYIPSGYEDAAMVDIPFIYTYNDYRIDGTKETIEQRYEDNEQQFYVIIPKEWYDKVTIKKLENGVRILDNKEEKTLFEVKWVDKASYSDSNTKLGETKSTIYYTENKNNLPIPIKNFHLLEEDMK